MSMQIHVGEGYEIVLSNVFNAIVIRTDQGDFGVCERDGALEVMHDGKLVYASLHHHREEDAGPDADGGEG